MGWQALPPFVSDLTNLTAFDVRNGGIIIPQGNVPRPGFLQTINTASYTAQGCTPVVSSLPCAPVEYANTLGLGPGLRQFYKMTFQPLLVFDYRPIGNKKMVLPWRVGNFPNTNPW